MSSEKESLSNAGSTIKQQTPFSTGRWTCNILKGLSHNADLETCRRRDSEAAVTHIHVTDKTSRERSDKTIQQETPHKKHVMVLLCIFYVWWLKAFAFPAFVIITMGAEFTRGRLLVCVRACVRACVCVCVCVWPNWDRWVGELYAQI